jgi:hypothetical protein
MTFDPQYCLSDKCLKPEKCARFGCAARRDDAARSYEEAIKAKREALYPHFPLETK